MRSKFAVLCSTSVAALALVAASGAAAQTTDPATPPDPTVEAQEQPADPEAGSAQTDDAVQTATGQDQARNSGQRHRLSLEGGRVNLADRSGRTAAGST